MWDDKCQEAFEELKWWLMNIPVLHHYQPELETWLETDASDRVVAGVLTQQYRKDWHPVAFYSKSMSDAEQNYEIHNKEMLAII